MNFCSHGSRGWTWTSGFGDTTKFFVFRLKDQKSPRERETLRNGTKSTCSESLPLPLRWRSHTTRGTPFRLSMTWPPVGWALLGKSNTVESPLLRTPWGPGRVSCMERCLNFRNPSIVDTGVSCIERCPRSGVKLYKKTYLGHSKASLTHRCSYFWASLVLYKFSDSELKTL